MLTAHQDLLQIALKATEIAQTEILKHFGRHLQVELKPDQSPVTIADRNSEDLVRTFLAKETPECGFIGEESGVSLPDAEYQWILDPIDGTKAFVHNVPLFGTLLACYKGGVPLIGIIRLPVLRSVLWALQGQGAWVDGWRTHTSRESSLSKALVLSGTINTMEDKGWGEGFTRLRRSAGLHRGWGDCYGYYLVATGQAEVMVDPIVSIWDVAPMPVIVGEAGGRFSTLQGETSLLMPDGTFRAEGLTGFATNGLLHEDALGLMQIGRT